MGMRFSLYSICRGRSRRATPGRNLGRRLVTGRGGDADICSVPVAIPGCRRDANPRSAIPGPAIFFTRPFRFLIGEEPAGLVSGGLYRFSRNPMYVGVLLAVFGRAMLFKSAPLAAYGCTVFACFHVIVVLVDEPHLRATRGRS